MKKTLSFLLLALLMPLLLQSAKPASAAEWWVGVRVGFGPPALPIYDQPLCPGTDYIWTPGYWAWDPDDGYYWVPGTWVLAPEAGFLWTPGWWGWDNGGFIWNEGYWGPEVGFYGGINYGFGYFGTGFYGGRWQGGHFFYNTAVWHVDETNIHNVYRDTTVNSRMNDNHISYNGGQGGIAARPTAEEQRFASQRHVAPVADQTRQVEMAHSNPQLRASANQGRPPVAATARPGEFSGRDVVQARQAGGEYHAQPMGRAAQPGGGGAAPGGAGTARPGNPTHASELQPHQVPQLQSTGNAKLDQKFQKQQQQLVDRQNQEHQKLAQQQQKEDQRAQQQNNQQRIQQMEQQHQQQTQQMEQRHQQQAQQLTNRQSSKRPR